VRIEVPGIPAPQGSKNRGANGQMYEANANLGPWRDAVIWRTRQACRPPEFPLLGPVQVIAVFVFPHPKGHYGTGKNAATVRPSAPRFPDVKPDLDKLARAVLDGLTQGGAFKDDAQVCELLCRKRYGPRPGVVIMVNPMEGE